MGDARHAARLHGYEGLVAGMSATAVETHPGRVVPRDLTAALRAASATRAREVLLHADCSLAFGVADAAARLPFAGRPWNGDPCWLDRASFARIARACNSDMLIERTKVGVTLRAGALSAELPAVHEPTPDLAHLEVDARHQLTVDALQLARLLLRAAPFAGRDETRPAIKAVALDMRRGKVVATDSYRLAVLDAPVVKKRNGRTLAISVDAIVPLATALVSAGGEVTIGRTDTHATFSFAGQTWALRIPKGYDRDRPARRPDAVYPDWANLLPDVDPLVALSASAGDLATAASLIDDVTLRHRPMALTVARDGLVAATHGNTPIKVRQTVDATVSAAPDDSTTIGLNPRFVAQIASAIAPERAEVEIITPLRPILLTSTDAVFLLMPIRLDA